MKKEIENKINDINQMMKDIALEDIESSSDKAEKSDIDINGLDVLEVLNNILN